MNAKQLQLEEARRRELQDRLDGHVTHRRFRTTQDEFLGWLNQNTGHGGFEAGVAVARFGKSAYRHLRKLVQAGLVLKKAQGFYVLKSCHDAVHQRAVAVDSRQAELVAIEHLINQKKALREQIAKLDEQLASYADHYSFVHKHLQDALNG